jgi:hypothetical protein
VTSENQTFTGVNGKVDHSIFDADIDEGNYIVNNYEPGSDRLISISDPIDSVEITAIDSDITYTNNADSAHGHAVGEVVGGSIATTTGAAIITELPIFI